MDQNRVWIPQKHRTEEVKVPHPPADKNKTMTKLYEETLERIKLLWMKREKDIIKQSLRASLSSIPIEEHHQLVFFLLDGSEDLRSKKLDSVGLVILQEFERVVKSKEKV